MPRISYVAPASIADPELREYLEDARLHGTPRPESQAVRAHHPDVLRPNVGEPHLVEVGPGNRRCASLPSPRLTESVKVPWSQFERSVRDLHGFIQRNHQIPNAVWLGSKPVAPEVFLVAMAKIASQTANGSAPPEKVTVAPARLATEKYVAIDSPEIWLWPIFPTGFHSEHLMELARLQAWTLKPAKRSE